jgi:hypothetical protein
MSTEYAGEGATAQYDSHEQKADSQRHPNEVVIVTYSQIPGCLNRKKIRIVIVRRQSTQSLQSAKVSLAFKEDLEDQQFQHTLILRMIVAPVACS